MSTVTVESMKPPPLSAKDENSFAYPSMKDRVPVIVTKIVDHLNKDREALMREYQGENVGEELKTVIGALSQLRHEIMTNKPAIPIRDDLPDAETWNKQLQIKTEEASWEPPTWFDSAWLWMECYLYRRIQEASSLTTQLKSLDVFKHQKKESLHKSYPAISKLTIYLLEALDCVKEGMSPNIDCYFRELLQISLWGNKCDLSISAGNVSSPNESPVEQLSILAPNILIDSTEKVLEVLRKAIKVRGGQAGPVAFVLDNAGFELMTDLCLAEYLITSGLASCIHFHAKAMPWYVSDVTEKDFNSTLFELSAMNHIAISKLSQTWNRRMKDGTWKLQSHYFWTLPFAFHEIKSFAPDLYTELEKFDLVIFKGDLNYRKLVGDLKWDPTVDFSHSLQGFHPAPICSLRTLKADVVVGLKLGQAEEVASQNPNWMISGEYAVISLDE